MLIILLRSNKQIGERSSAASTSAAFVVARPSGSVDRLLSGIGHGRMFVIRNPFVTSSHQATNSISVMIQNFYNNYFYVIPIL
jgi:hypothetical protein